MGSHGCFRELLGIPGGVRGVQVGFRVFSGDPKGLYECSRSVSGILSSVLGGIRGVSGSFNGLQWVPESLMG